MTHFVPRPPRLFIASTSEGFPYADALKRALQPDVEGTLWNEGVLAPGEYALDSLSNARRQFDGALVVATADDRVVVRREQSAAPRDNLVFEFGLFVALWGRHRALLLAETEASLKLPTDVAGLTYLPFVKSENPDLDLAEAASSIKKLVPRWRDELVDPETTKRIQGLLRLAVSEVQERTGITDGFGLHVWVVDRGTEPARLRRVARERLGPKSAKPQEFARGEGVIGTCWAREDEVFLDLAEAPFSTASEIEWNALDLDQRVGMEWSLLTWSRNRFDAVGAVPITGFRQESGFAGCVSFNLGRSSGSEASTLREAKAMRVMRHLAESLAVLLGHWS